MPADRLRAFYAGCPFAARLGARSGGRDGRCKTSQVRLDPEPGNWPAWHSAAPCRRGSVAL